MACTITADEMRKVLKILDDIVVSEGTDTPIVPNDVAFKLGVKVDHARSIIKKLIRVGCLEKIALSRCRNTYKVVGEQYDKASYLQY